MRRRRSKNFVKLSGKRTVTGLYSGEHAHILGVTDGEPMRQNSQVQQTETKVDSSTCVSVFIFIRK